ncbi:MAG: peptidoglycan DD-metalloendopeptidase family protein [Beijerinckiaceae bacterium]
MLSAPYRSVFSLAVVDLGLEPAIELNGGRQKQPDRRRVSARWLWGTILTGFAGMVLLGAAVYAALDHQSNFAEAPTSAQLPRKEADTGINPRKGDRLVKAVDIVAARQRFRLPTPIKVGDKEVMKTHSFTHIETTLLAASAGFTDEVPPFNPLQLLADIHSNPVDIAAEPVQDDAEVSWATRDLAAQYISLAAVLSPDEVQAQVAEHIKSSISAGNSPLSLPPQLLLMRTSHANAATGTLAYANMNDPITTSRFSAIEVRMVPENVTIVPRPNDAHETTQMEQRLVVIRHGETLDDVLRAAGIPRERIEAIVAAFAPKRGEPVVPEGRRLKLLFADLDGSGRNMTLARISVYSGEALETTIALRDQGDYLMISGLEPGAKKTTANNEADDDDEDAGMRLYDSVYETALKQEIPRPIINDLIRMFANDVDFQRAVSSGDSFVVFYDEGDEGENRNELLYASITTRNETFRYYRFQAADDSLVDFYDQNGRSTRKFLVRTPIVAGRLTSGFGVRYHPILGYSRPHTGVDWAAPIGTQIFAAGNGTIISAGWDSGYGRRIEIQHANGYVTTYNHLSGFARGVAEGARVRQGQIIGYLGQSGLATGPHLHYEVLVNGHFVDPMRVKLARTREFNGPMLAEFKRARDRIDALMAKAPNAAPLVANRQ